MASNHKSNPDEPSRQKIVKKSLRRYQRKLQYITLKESLQKAEIEVKKYRELYESIPFIYFTLDLAGMIIAVNPIGAARLGYATQELIQTSIFDLFDLEDQGRLKAAFTSFSYSSSLIGNLEVRAYCQDGSSLWVKAIARAVPKLNTDLDVIILSCEEISEQRREEAEWERFFTLSLDLLCICGFDGYYKRLNPAWEKILGFSRQELLTKPFIEFVHPEDQAATTAELQRLVAGADTIGFENRYRCQDGSIKWLSWRSKTSIDEQVIYAVARDITHEKEMEAALQQSNERTSRILESMTHAFYALDRQWRFTYLNTEAEQLLQRNREELLGQCLWEQFPQTVTSEIYVQYHKAASEQVAVEVEEFNPQLQQWFAIHAYPFPEGIAVYLNDITIRKQAEETLRQSEQTATAQVEELARLHALKDEFLSTVSHELRSPITNMKMAIRMLALSLNQQQPLFSEMAKPQAEQSKIARYFQVLQDECEREINLINDLLDLQRLDAGEQSLKQETICLQTWLYQVIEPFRVRTRSREQTLQIDIAQELPPLVSDSSSLERLLTELLNNACKYTPPGERIILQAGVQSQTIQLQVINEGVEIPAAELPRIFDKFYRVPSADPWKQGGTGLGLTLAKKLTQHLGGRIAVESARGRTCFTVELPMNNAENEVVIIDEF